MESYLELDSIEAPVAPPNPHFLNKIAGQQRLCHCLGISEMVRQASRQENLHEALQRLARSKDWRFFLEHGFLAVSFSGTPV